MTTRLRSIDSSSPANGALSLRFPVAARERPPAPNPPCCSIRPPGPCTGRAPSSASSDEPMEDLDQCFRRAVHSVPALPFTIVRAFPFPDRAAPDDSGAGQQQALEMISWRPCNDEVRTASAPHTVHSRRCAVMPLTWSAVAALVAPVTIAICNGSPEWFRLSNRSIFSPACCPQTAPPPDRCHPSRAQAGLVWRWASLPTGSPVTSTRSASTRPMAFCARCGHQAPRP
jgi:hypothetical protein